MSNMDSNPRHATGSHADLQMRLANFCPNFYKKSKIHIFLKSFNFKDFLLRKCQESWHEEGIVEVWK